MENNVYNFNQNLEVFALLFIDQVEKETRKIQKSDAHNLNTSLIEKVKQIKNAFLDFSFRSQPFACGASCLRPGVST